MSPFDIPGLRISGLTLLGDGSLLPEFEMVAPEGRASINTREGWNALAERMRNNENRVSSQ